MTTSPALQKFYVYAYLRKNGTPYYIGKGFGRRAFHPLNRHVATPKDRTRVQFLAQNMYEHDALQSEILLIAVYGRKDNGTGVLRNMTNGGEGMAGRIVPEPERLRRSLRLKGAVRTFEHCRAISDGKKGFIVTEKHRQQISKKMTGRTLSLETRQLISNARRGIAQPKLQRSGNPRAKVTDADVLAIRSGAINERQALALWTLSRTQFYRLRRGEQWHL